MLFQGIFCDKDIFNDDKILKNIFYLELTVAVEHFFVGF